jgi:hypothetical protein
MGGKTSMRLHRFGYSLGCLSYTRSGSAGVAAGTVARVWRNPLQKVVTVHQCLDTSQLASNGQVQKAGDVLAGVGGRKRAGGGYVETKEMKPWRKPVWEKPLEEKL